MRRLSSQRRGMLVILTVVALLAGATMASPLAAVTCEGQTATWTGTNGNDFYWAPFGVVNVLASLGGDDYIYGGNLGDKICGNLGNDRLYARYGNDTASGDEGDDVVAGDSENDTLRGKDGSDVEHCSAQRNLREQRGKA